MFQHATYRGFHVVRQCKEALRLRKHVLDLLDGNAMIDDGEEADILRGIA